jgi:putative flippase GtrA
MFALVGALGFVCQIGVLHLLTSAGLPVGPSTALAVLAAIVTNFVWHRRWTWADRSQAAQSIPAQFLRFAGLNGAVSLAGNVVITAGLASAGAPVVGANVIAVVACSAVNFVLADRVVFAVAGVLLAAAASAEAAPAVVAVLGANTRAAWLEYVRVTEQRIAAQEPKPLPRPSEADWRRLKAGELILAKTETRRADGSAIDVPDGAIHHWVGRVFLPNVQLADLLRELQRPTSKRWTPAEVLSMRVVPLGDGTLQVFMRVARSGIVDVTYDMEHAVRYTQHPAGHATSRSVSRRIVEVDDPGTPRERARPEGDDHGFLWRLNAYWRYVPVEGGVLVECESIALSRGVPLIVRALASPIISRVSRESLENTLAALRHGFAKSAASLTDETVGKTYTTAAHPRPAMRSRSSRLSLANPTA